MRFIFVFIMLCLGGMGVLAQNDRDGDGIPDTRDNCPDTAGVPELNGCPFLIIVTDSDGDGLNDNLDQCPTVPGLADNNGCPASNEPPPSAPENPPAVDPAPQPPAADPAPQPPPFSPPALPVDGCFVTPNGDYSVNVRETMDLSADRLGYLYSGVVYEALGYVIASDELWFVLTDYQESTGLAGYASRSVLNASACPELPQINIVSQVGLTWHTQPDPAPRPSTHEAFERLLDLSCEGTYVVYWNMDADGNEIPDTYGGYCTKDEPVLVQPPVPASSRSTPKLQESVAQGTYSPAVCYGVSVLAWARVDGTSSDDVIVDGNIITAENYDSANTCEPPPAEDQDGVWIFFGIGGDDTMPTRDDWDAALDAYCAGDYVLWWDENGHAGGICTDDMDAATESPRVPDGLGFATRETADPLNLTVIPSSTSDAIPTEEVTFGYTKAEWTYHTTGLDLDLRGTEFGEPQGNDDGTTTVEYCIYVELYEEGVFNQVCYEIEIPANCTLTTSEAGVYTVVCDAEGVVSLNPTLAGLPALDLSVPDSSGGVHMLLGDGSVRFIRDSVNP